MFFFLHLYVRASTLFNSTSATSHGGDNHDQMVKHTDKYNYDDDCYDDEIVEDADHDYHLQPLHDSEPEEDDDEDDQGSPPWHHIPEAGEDDDEDEDEDDNVLMCQLLSRFNYMALLHLRS